MKLSDKIFYLVNQSCGPLFIDIVNDMAEHGLKVKLITGQINKVQKNINDDVCRVILTKYSRSSILSRFISWLSFFISLFFIAIFSKRNSVWMITTNPPLAPWLTFLIKLKSSKVCLLIYDIYPEVLSASNIVSSSQIIYRNWFSINQRIYKKADMIVCIGDSMAEYLISQNFELKNKIFVIPNWNIINFNNVNSEINIYKTTRNTNFKIHIVYSGNLGATHDFQTILEAAKTLQKDDRFVFSIIGEGFQAEKIKRFISQYDLLNIVWEPFKKASEVADVFLSADVFLVTLGPGVEKSSIPSKTYDALAAGAALLVIAPEGSELEYLVNKGNVGKCFKPSDSDKVVEWLIELSENYELLCGYKQAAKKLSEQYSPKNTEKYVELLTNL